MATGVGKRVGNYTMTLHPILGQGAYGIVYKGHRGDDKDDLIAAKYSRWYSEYVTEATDHEANIMKSMRPHENITAIIDYIKENTVEDGIKYVDVWMILEFCCLKDLSVFAMCHPLTFPQKVDAMLQCTHALNHLHSQKPAVIHRDIKPQNILVSGRPSAPIFKLADYGTSRFFERLPQFKLKTMTAGMGSCPYMAPELFAKEPKYNESADTYSLGVSFSTLLCSQKGKLMRAVNVDKKELGRYMFKEGMIEIEELKEKPGDSLDMKNVKILLREMIELNPKSRPSAQEILNRFNQLCSSYTDVWESLRPYDPAPSDTAQPVEGKTDASAIPSSATASAATASAATAFAATVSTVSTVRPKDVAVKDTLGKTLTLRIKRFVTGIRTPDKKSTDETSAGNTEKADAAPASTSAVSLPQDAAPSDPITISVREVSRTVLPVRGTANLWFGQGGFIVGDKDTNESHFYENKSDEYIFKWVKSVPEGFWFDCYKHISPSKDIYLQSNPCEASLFNGELELHTTLSTPGMVIGLLTDGKLAVLSDEASPGTATSVVRLSVAPVDSLHEAHHLLEVPEDGPYTRQDKLHACGLGDGRVAVASWNKSFIDVHDNRGKHIKRASLPSGAGVPGCSQAYIIVPLWGQPRICLVDWSGELRRALGPGDLGLSADVRCLVVSSASCNRLFSCWAASSKHTVHTYEIVQKGDTHL